MEYLEFTKKKFWILQIQRDRVKIFEGSDTITAYQILVSFEKFWINMY